MTTNNKISTLVSSQVPFFVRNDHANFVRFLEAYYEYLEQSGQLVDTAKNILSYADIDRTLGDFEQKLYEMYLKLIPEETTVDKRLLLKHIKDFYQARGSEKSIRFLMNILYGDDSVEFYYPKKDVLRASDGKWYIQKSLRVFDTVVDNTANNSLIGLNKFINRQIRGNTSNATATVERVDRFFERGTQVDELTLTSILGTFVNGEQVYALFDDEGGVKSITSNVFGGILNTVNITNAGAGYNVGDHPIVESTSGTGANVRIDRVTSGNIASITVIEGGAGYQNNIFLLFTGGGSGSGANAQVNLIIDDNSVHPNSYNIAISAIALEANTNVRNSSANGIYESFAYQNLNTIYTNTSNLRANSGVSLSSLNLSSWLANSNVYFETFDSLNLTNQISGVSNTVLITSTNTVSNVVYISPAFSTRQGNLTIRVIKKANVNTSIGNSLSFFTYANTGPIRSVIVRDSGSNYTSLPDISVLANTRIKELQILGRMVINNGGSGYVIGDTIQFINPPGGFGYGAAANVTNVDGSGRITEVKFVPVAGEITGGSGYNVLPIANIVTSTGNGANITVTQRLGEGGDYIIANTTLGAIQQITILERGSGYTSPPTINLTTLGDGTATANATILEGVFTYPGRYLNDDGFLSSYNFLQDRDYYQEFSYVLKLKQSIANYRKAVKELVHPAGTKLFGAYVVEDEQELVPYSTGGETALNYKNVVKTYGKVGNTINVLYTSHGLSVNDKVFLEFTSGGTKNVKNGIYTITFANTNYFSVIQPKSGVNSITITNAGLGYNSNSYLVFSVDSGNRANGTFTVNASGSIVTANITDFGKYYNSIPTVTANGSNITPATFTVTLEHYANNTTGNVNVSVLVV